MPISGAVTLRSTALALLAGLVLVGVAEAEEAEEWGPRGCPAARLAQPFLPWGDHSWYALAPGGHFEGHTSQWTLTGALRVADNEPWAVAGSGVRALHLPGPATRAVSPRLCVDAARPHLRFFVRELRPGSGPLQLRLSWVDDAGVARSVLAGTVATSAKPGWRPSPAMAFATALPLPPAGTMEVRLAFAPAPGSGAWRIDAVHVDPYRKG